MKLKNKDKIYINGDNTSPQNGNNFFQKPNRLTDDTNPVLPYSFSFNDTFDCNKKVSITQDINLHRYPLTCLCDFALKYASTPNLLDMGIPTIEITNENDYIFSESESTSFQVFLISNFD